MPRWYKAHCLYSWFSQLAIHDKMRNRTGTLVDKKVTEMYKISGTPMVLCWTVYSKGWPETFKTPKLVLMFLKIAFFFFQQSISLGIKTQKMMASMSWFNQGKVINTEHLNRVGCMWEWKHIRKNKENKEKGVSAPVKCRPSVPQPLPSSWRDYNVQDKYCVLLRIPHTSYIYPLPPSSNFTNDFHKEKQTGRSPVLNIYTNRSHMNLTVF